MTDLSPYAIMMNELNGYQVLKNGKEIDKWEFYAYHKSTPIDSAKSLLKNKLSNYSFKEKIADEHMV